MKKNDKIIGICTSYTHEGHGVVKIDGFPLFVKNMMVNEEAEIIATMVKKNYGFGRVVRLIQSSDQRVTPKCSLAKVCGGCQLQHMSALEQASFKHQKVKDVITRIGKLSVEVEPILSMEYPFSYRNKGQIPVGMQQGQAVCGFYRIHSNEIIDMKTCPIQSDQINIVLEQIRKFIVKYPSVAKPMRHLLIKHAFHTNEVMVVFIARKGEIENLTPFMKDLVHEVPNIKSIILNINTRDDNVILGQREIVLYGNRTITDTIHDLSFCISSKSFYQVNPIQTEILYGKVLEFAQLNGTETVLDLYCGVGTISMFLAQKAKQVIGIEIVPQAIEDAKRNVQLNNLTNIEFVCSDVAEYATKLSQSNHFPDVIVVDPPRKGCDQETLDSIVKMQPKKMIYVSCDPATLARDLRILEDNGYYTKKIQPVDMFPQTFHVENVVLLTNSRICK